MPVRAAKRLSWVSSAGTRPWSSSADGRSWRARLSSSSIAWLTSRLSSATSGARSGGRLLGERLEPQQDRGERLVDLVVEVAREPAALLLLGAHGELARAAALLLDALRAGRGRSCARRSISSTGSARRSSSGGRLGRVDRLDLVDQALERAKAALQHPEVGAEREHDREREDQELPALVARRRGRARRRRSRANSVSATSTTLAATIWPIRESSRRVIRGLSLIGMRPSWTNGVSTPYRQAAPGRNC